MTRATLLLIALTLALPAVGDDWPFFRGPTRDGRSAEAKAPLNWDAKTHIKWKAKLPRPGNSSPVVAGSRVFVTCAEDAQGVGRSLYCFDRADGKQLWVQTVKYEQKESTHATNPYCGSSPATDGNLVVVWHGSAGLHAYTVDGKPVWSLDTGRRGHIWGYGASPLIHDGVVYQNCGPGEGHHIVAVTLADGKVLWDVPEARAANDKYAPTKGWVGSWSTPIVAKIGGRPQLLLFQSGRVNAYDPKAGKLLWTADGAGDLAYTDVMLAPEQNVGIAVAGYGGAGVGFSIDPASPGKQLWRADDKPAQRIGSGVIVGKHLYLPAEPAIQCIDITTGKIAWSHREQGASFWSSIVMAGDRAYATTKGGTTLVFTPDPAGFKLLATNALGDATNATPAISNGQIFLRTNQYLWCISE